MTKKKERNSRTQASKRDDGGNGSIPRIEQTGD